MTGRRERPEPVRPGQREALGCALISPVMVAAMPARAWLYLVLYVGLAAGLLLPTAWLITSYRHDIEDLLLSYLFPESWQFAARELAHYLFAAQHRAVIINAVVAASLMAVSVTLFPVKEKMSAAFEARRELVPEPMSEHPLWQQGWQEIKLFALFAALQGAIFLFGFLPHRGWQYVAIAAGHLLIWLVFAVDFIAPLLQRHGGHYSRIFKTLARRPPAALAFGAIFSAPALIVGTLWQADPSWTWGRALSLLFGVNVLCIAWAAGSGTWLASRLFGVFARARRSHGATRAAATAAVLALLAGNAYIYGALGLAVHHKSQLLKCEYSGDFGSISLDSPGLSALLGGRVELAAGIDVRIANPTPFDVAIEDSELVVSHAGEPVARTRVAPMAVPAGGAVTQRVAFTLAVEPAALARGRSLLDRESWQLVLYVDLAPYLRMPIPLVRAGPGR